MPLCHLAQSSLPWRNGVNQLAVQSLRRTPQRFQLDERLRPGPLHPINLPLLHSHPPGEFKCRHPHRLPHRSHQHVISPAAADGNPPGTVTRTTPKFSRDYPPTLTAHDIGVKNLLDVFYIQGGGPDVVLYAITIDPRQPISMELSPAIAKAAEVAVAEILAELEPNSAA